jgi:hypothetical protein
LTSHVGYCHIICDEYEHLCSYLRRWGTNCTHSFIKNTSIFYFQINGGYPSRSPLRYRASRSACT